MRNYLENILNNVGSMSPPTIDFNIIQKLKNSYFDRLAVETGTWRWNVTGVSPRLCKVWTSRTGSPIREVRPRQIQILLLSIDITWLFDTIRETKTALSSVLSLNTRYNVMFSIAATQERVFSKQEIIIHLEVTSDGELKKIKAMADD